MMPLPVLKKICFRNGFFFSDFTLPKAILKDCSKIESFDIYKKGDCNA